METSSKNQTVAAIKAYDAQGLADVIKDAGQPAFRARQLREWLYGKGARSYDDMSNLPKTLRSELATSHPLFPAKAIDRQESSDGTRKDLIAYQDGVSVETVGIPTEDRLTVCFSTQAGCAMGCAFCATGSGGFTRNLLPGEMLDQVQIVAEDFGRRVSNVVGMGQGEPFANYKATIGALRFMNDAGCLGIGARHITVSTCGIIPGIERFSHEPEQFTLAVSLHSAVQSTRDTLMPGVRSYPLPDLRSALIDYSELTGRRPTLEYVLIADVNDSAEHLEALSDYCTGMLVHVNLIMLNQIEGSPLQGTTQTRARYFESRLTASGTETSIRTSRGADIAGACGQLKQLRARERNQETSGLL